MTKSNASLDFDKDLWANMAAADASMKTGTRIIVFYVGDSSVRTEVAIENLGSTPLQKSCGTVYKMEKHEHLLKIKDASGNIESFQIIPKTIAETALGVVEGFKYHPDKGDQVQIIANGSSTALYIGAV